MTSKSSINERAKVAKCIGDCKFLKPVATHKYSASFFIKALEKCLRVAADVTHNIYFSYKLKKYNSLEYQCIK